MGGSHSSRRESRVCWASRRRNEPVKLHASDARDEVKPCSAEVAHVVNDSTEQLSSREAARFVCSLLYATRTTPQKFTIDNAKSRSAEVGVTVTQTSPELDIMVNDSDRQLTNELRSTEKDVTVMQASPETAHVVNDCEEQLSPDSARLRSAEDFVTVMATSPETVTPVMVDNPETQLSTDKVAQLRSAEEAATVMQASLDSDGLPNADNVRSHSAEEKLNVSNNADSCVESKSDLSFNVLTQETAVRQGKDKGKGKDKGSGKGTEKVSSKSGSKGKGKGKSKPKEKRQPRVA